MEEQSSEGERQSKDEQLAGDAEQKQAGPTGPGTHTFENEQAEGQLGMQQLFRGSERFSIFPFPNMYAIGLFKAFSPS